MEMGSHFIILSRRLSSLLFRSMRCTLSTVLITAVLPRIMVVLLQLTLKADLLLDSLSPREVAVPLRFRIVTAHRVLRDDDMADTHLNNNLVVQVVLPLLRRSRTNSLLPPQHSSRPLPLTISNIPIVRGRELRAIATSLLEGATRPGEAPHQTANARGRGVIVAASESRPLLILRPQLVVIDEGLRLDLPMCTTTRGNLLISNLFSAHPETTILRV